MNGPNNSSIKTSPSSGQKNNLPNKARNEATQSGSSSESEDDFVDVPSSTLQRNTVTSSGARVVSVRSSNRERDKTTRGWAILEGYSGSPGDTVKMKQPGLMEGYLLKRRKWPMKGWHKRYFRLEDGILKYSKTLQMLQRGRLHGTLDTGLSVISFHAHRCRMDIDDEAFVHHIKLKDPKVFLSWIEALRQHRIYRQWRMDLDSSPPPPMADDVQKTIRGQEDFLKQIMASSNESSVTFKKNIVDGTDGENVVKPGESSFFENSDTSLTQIKVKIEMLNTLKSKLENCMKQAPPSPAVSESRPVARKVPEHAAAGSGSTATLVVPSSGASNLSSSSGISLSSSNPNLNQALARDDSSASLASTGQIAMRFSPGHHRTLTDTKVSTRPLSTGANALAGGNGSSSTNSASATVPSGDTGSSTSLPVSAPMTPSPVLLATAVSPSSSTSSSGSASSTEQQQQQQMQKQFLSLTSEVVRECEKTLDLLARERARYLTLAQRVQENRRSSLHRSPEMFVSDEVKVRLLSVRQEFDQLFSALYNTPLRPPSLRNRQPSFLPSIRSNSIDMDSADLYYDAEDHFAEGSQASSSSEDSDGESGENESEGEPDEQSNLEPPVNLVEVTTGRRERLPVPMPQGNGFSLVNLLCKNIGRDLSKVRMPVTMHEPLSALQRLCEELEYSELLDTAASASSPVERMMYVAAFAVSGYAATYYRSGMKPFNPVLGETFENVRQDKGWRFMSEQVSHHPPVSSCHCTHENWTWWQDLRLRNKFWGKSLEAIPVGSVFLSFPKLKETYRWNKVTTCINNLFGEKRTIEHYGDMRITSSSGVTCHLTFHRATTSWTGANTGQRFQVSGEVRGTVPEGEKKSSGAVPTQALFGRWNEGLYCGRDKTARCIWRPGAIPPEHELYYGFTRFAIELNHLDDQLRRVLPKTDSRFRPDQRLLEEGQLAEAEAEKLRVEAIQRTRIGDLPEGREENWKPLWFQRGSDEDSGHRFTAEYWTVREKDPGFTNKELPSLW